MEPLHVLDTYSQRLIDLWAKYDSLPFLNAEGYEYRKSPLMPAEIKKNSLLFVGINPSFPKGATIEAAYLKLGWYTLQTDGEKHIPYFHKFQEFATYCQCDWDHLDLLFVRETNQKAIEELTYDRATDRPNGLDFIGEQLDISFEILEALEPKAIVVANAFASEFFGKKKVKHNGFKGIWRSYDLDFKAHFDNELGTYRIPLNGKQVPIFFSGMLSGQRALDLGSLERLMWGVKRVINFETN